MRLQKDGNYSTFAVDPSIVQNVGGLGLLQINLARVHLGHQPAATSMTPH